MLCQFSFQNFRSYRGETTLDFQAAALPEFRETLISSEHATDLLPVNVVYGPNGGGKSNLLAALACVISTVVSPVLQLGKTRRAFVLQQNIPVVPFRFDDVSRTEPTEFRLFFRAGDNEYGYYLAWKDGAICEESLYRKALSGKKPAMIFEREANAIELGYSIRKQSINRSVNPKMPYLSFLAINYDIPAITEAMQWFEGCIIQSYARPAADAAFSFLQNDTEKKALIQALNDMDIDITDLRLEEQSHRLYTTRRIDGTTYELSFDEESEGTQKLITALPVLLLALSEGRMVIIDELDAKLHPKLLRYVIQMFQNRDINRHGAQLLFTSHDMYTMKNTVFRRDEIWFAAENHAHESELYSLYEIRGEDHQRIKNTAAYDKQYMEGRYGADPYLSNLLGGDFA
ncbi:MAG: ATP-binding protein [Selenomonadaceae bacterium]|nr:ATP-binding protein [Selenomonadaceae bacterium]